MITPSILQYRAPEFVPFPSSPGVIVPMKSRKRLRRQIRRGEALYRAGDSLQFLHVVHVGVFRCSTASGAGLMQVIGFPMAGDVLGLDGIDTGMHSSDAVALEDAEVFAFPLAQCRQWMQESAHGQRLVARAMACEIIRAQELMILLGTMRAVARLATFLLDLSERHGRLGYSRSELVLRMTRHDIGSYLGLTIETVSRSLAHLQDGGVVKVEGKLIALIDIPALWRHSGLSPDCPRSPAVAIADREGELLLV